MAGLPRRPRTPTRRGSLARTAAAACMMTVLATACLDLQMDLVVHDDGSGSLNVTVRIDAAMVALVALGEGGSAEDSCQQAAEEAGVVETADLGPDVLDSSIEAVVENGDCVVTATSAWRAGDSETVLDSLAEDGGPRIRRLSEGGWRFDWGLDFFEEESASDDLAGTATDLAGIATMGLDLPTLTIAVTLPGEPVEHNAQSVHQSTYTWVLDTADPSGYPETLYAETAAGGGGLGPAAIGGIVAGIVLALAALVTLRNHQQAKAADSEDAEPTGNDVPETADEASDSDEDTDEASDGDTPGPDDGDDHLAQRSTET